MIIKSNLGQVLNSEVINKVEEGDTSLAKRKIGDLERELDGLVSRIYGQVEEFNRTFGLNLKDFEIKAIVKEIFENLTRF